MKRIRLLFLLLTSIPSLSFTRSNNNSFFSITAFEVEISSDNKKAKIINKYSSTIEDSYAYCDIIWRINKDGVEEYLYYLRMGNFKVVKNGDVPIQPEIDLSKLGEENEFILYFYPSDTKTEHKEKVRFNIKGKSKVTFSEKDNDVGVSSGYIVESWSKFDSNKNIIKEDRITFTNYEDLVVEDYYLNFDIRRFKYFYTGNKEILEGDFYFLIYDKYNLFPDLPIYKDSQYRYIELKPNVINGDSIFSFKENIYYDPLTHNPSIKYKEGYKETSKLYFPIGQLNTLKSIHCMFSFDIKGYTNFNMSSEFDIYFLRNYFGDCSDSEYCVEMNSDEGDNVREKVVEVDL